MSQEIPDEVPGIELAPAPQRRAEITIMGDDAVDLLDKLVSHMKGVNTQKFAILRMMGIFEAAVGKQIMIKGEEGEPLVVRDLWK